MQPSDAAFSFSPLMWLLFAHLLVGGVLTGVAQAVLLRVLTAAPWRRAIGWLVMGNYLAVAAVAGIAALFERLAAGPPDPTRTLDLIVAGVAAGFVAAVAVLAPFVSIATSGRLWPDTGAWARALILQGVTFVVLVPLYVDSSSRSFVTQTTRILPTELRTLPGVWIYHQEPATGDVWRMTLDGSRRERMAAAPPLVDAQIAAHDVQTLTAWPGGPQSWTMPVDGVPVRAPPGRRVQPAADLSDGRFTGSTGFWASDGVRIRDVTTGAAHHFALETPFVSWSVGNATILPNGWIVCRVRSSIVLLDPWRQQFAVLAEGYAPVLVIGNE